MIKMLNNSFQTHENSEDIILEGIISIEAAIKSGHRKIFNVFADKDKYDKRDRKAIRFLSFLKKEDIKYTLCERSFIDSITDGTTHGGFAATVSERTYSYFEDLLEKLSNQKGSYAVYLDGVEDPFNFGYSIRNLFAFGCKNFIVPQRNWMSAASTVAKASAGASELCNISIAPNDDDALNSIRRHGVKIVCAGLSGTSVALNEFSCNDPFILFIGGEKRGISKLFFENADTVVHIPYSNSDATYSLPTASCAAIFGNYLSNINEKAEDDT